MTTQSLINKLLRQYKEFGQTYLYTPSNYLYCFPKEILNDLVIQIRSNWFTNEPIYFDKSGDVPSNLTIKDIQKLCQSLKRLEVIYDEEFHLHKSQISNIHNLIKEKDTPYTHIRFFSINNEIKVRIFDYTSFVNELYVKDKPIEVFEEHIESTFIQDDFNFSINVLTFKELPVGDYIVKTFGDEYIKFTNMNDVSYYIRNQNIQEPIVNVINDQSGQDIVFCFQPTTDVASDHTNQ
jgi:hypothetical protein